ncbi:pentapeptide repeat-containing protein [Rothia mucilaginosa]|uniref:pentapeptide repeat-containing protein n=1 Tax=Rothia mucilaginosa TaxID=43675 RepID=UPI0026EBE75F|nr:pentapeptide repeat-containing protein [Rothia mucilaginosa]
MPSNNASPLPESPVIPKDQEKPWYIRHFIKLLIGFGLGGGAVAILLPWMLWLHCGMSSGSSDQLRLHLLYVTGGIIAVLTLLQTNWKNQGDRLKIDADIKKNEQDAENEAAKREQDAVKSERDHTRQVHAERRSRYTTAVGQLADEKVPIRLGGIYTLTGLIDEWLADSTLNEEEQQKEGQVIINNLCSYIRSPFPLALKAEMFEGDSEPDDYEGDFSKDQAAFHEEQDVRRTIFVEMSKRSSTFTRDGVGSVIDTFPGKWSDFEFDFSRAPIFYPLDAITIEKGDFSAAKFYSNADFREAIFTQTVNFSGATFTQTANFSGATFTQYAGFSGATFTQYAGFSGATFNQTANFSRATFTQTANFSGATFNQTANFSRAIFTQYAGFSGATFNQTTNFSETTFTQYAGFSGATFNQTANFSRATFTQTANYSNATFSVASPKFVETFEISGMTFRTRFATLPADQEAHNFAVYEGSQPIPLGTAGLNGVGYRIPVGTVLFDPASWDERQKEYTRLSEPAQ